MPNRAVSRRSFVEKTACAALGAAVSSAGCARTSRKSATKAKQPNLLFVLVDQMRAQEMGCAGHPTIQTPNLDAMAREGTLFENTVSCCPVCTPYRAGLLSGRYPLSTGLFMNDVRLPTELPSLAESLRDAGYQTGYIGKWHLDGPTRGGFTPPGPRRQGFDDFWAVANCHHDYMKAYMYRDDPEPIWLPGYEPDTQTDVAVEFLDSVTPDRPFCLLLSWGTPHNPYNLMPESYRVYDPERVQPRPNCAEPPRSDLAGYQAHITALDRNLGRLFAALESRGLDEDTLCVFTSDHGDMLGSHGQQRKQRPWDESVCVPLIVRHPGRIPTGVRNPTVTNTQDLMPTLLSLCGAPIPASVEGADLYSAWLGQRAMPSRSALIASYTPMGEAWQFSAWRGVRTDRHSYICNREKPWMLFDNQRDPYQLINLIDRPDRRGTRKKLEKELDRWLERTGDTFESPEAYLTRFGYDVTETHRHMRYTTEVGVHDL